MLFLNYDFAFSEDITQSRMSEVLSDLKPINSRLERDYVISYS